MMRSPAGISATTLSQTRKSVPSELEKTTASPSFGSAELSYLPFPGEMVAERTNMAFVYVSMARKRNVDLRTFLAAKMEAG